MTAPRGSALGAAILIVAGSVSASAQDARSALEAAESAMGIFTLTSLSFDAHGTLADTGEAGGGNAPRPVVKSYIADITFAPPAMRVFIYRTNPDGTPLRYGSVEVLFVSGSYAWDMFNAEDAPPPARGGLGGAPPAGAAGPQGAGPAQPGGGAAARDGAPGAAGPGRGAPPGPGRGGPIARQATAASVRRMQILLTPPGFIKAALQNNATVLSSGGNTLITFTTADGQKVTGSLNPMRLVSKVMTTNPVTNAPVEASFSNYQTFAGMSFPSRILQLEGAATVADLTVTAVRPNQGIALTVPEPVRQLAQPAGRGN